MIGPVQTLQEKFPYLQTWWALILLFFVTKAISFYLFKAVAVWWCSREYRRILKDPETACDIDAFVGAPERNPVKPVYVVLSHKSQVGNRRARTEPIPLETVDSSHVEGLRVARKKGTKPSKSDTNVQPIDSLLKDKSSLPIVVATIRMGFGHHRLAYSATSWALKTNRPVIFHDLLNIRSGTLHRDTEIGLSCTASVLRSLPSPSSSRIRGKRTAHQR
jgi:hypothetical protein